MKRILYIALIAAFASCSKDADLDGAATSSYSGERYILSAQTTDTNSKVGVTSESDKLTFTWSTGDQITLYDGDGNKAMDFTLATGAGEASATFASNGEFTPETDATYTAVYPASSEATLQAIDDTFAGGALALSYSTSDGASATTHIGESLYMKGTVDFSDTAASVSFAHQCAFIEMDLAGFALNSGETFEELRMYNRADNSLIVSLSGLSGNPTTAYLAYNPALVKADDIVEFEVESSALVYTTYIITDVDHTASSCYTPALTNAATDKSAYRYIVGNSGDWTSDKSAPLVYSHVTDDGHSLYTGFYQFNYTEGDRTFKIAQTTPADWDYAYGYKDSWDAGWNLQMGSSMGNLTAPTNNALYYLNLGEKYTDDYASYVEITSIGLNGSVTTSGWDVDTAFTQSTFDPYVWVIDNVAMTTGEYKIRFNESWTASPLPLGTSADNLIMGGDNIAFDQAAGNYRVELRLRNYRMQIKFTALE